MYACLHIPAPAGDAEALFQLALQFSPAVERTAADTVVFSITPLRRLMGPPHQVAAEICRLGNERNLQARLAIAAQPDTAILLARHYPGVTFAMAGEESFQLAPIPLTTFGGLLQNGMPEGARLDPELPGVFHRFAEAFRSWGLKTCGDLVAMPEKGIAERLGEAGVYLRNLAAGRIHRPLRVDPEETCYERQFELEHPLSLLEPLLFLFHRTLEDLCKLLRSQSRAARLLELKLTVAPAVLPPVSHCTGKPPGAVESVAAPGKEVVGYVLTFPVPIDDSAAMLKLVQLHLERHPLPGAVGAFSLRVEPAEPRRLQGGLFLPATPAPDKLHVTLKRIEGMVGEGNIGMPRLLDTHRPDAFELAIRAGNKPAKSSKRGLPADSQTPGGEPPAVLRLALRVFRPALHARVRLAGIAPRQVIAPGVKGTVLEAAGPWKISGEWWTVAPWVREEWDVELDDGAIYRIYFELNMREWYVHSVYD